MTNTFVSKYNSENAKIIDDIKLTHNWEVNEGFIADGLISPIDYVSANYKITVMLGESYGYYKGCTDIQLQPEQDYLGVGHPKRMTAKKVPMLMWLILTHIERGCVVTKDEFKAKRFLKTNKENTCALQNALKQIGWINVKKASKIINAIGDSSRQDPTEIIEHTKKNASILNRQLNLISPDLIIICSDPVFTGLNESGVIGKEILNGKKYQMQIDKFGKQIIHLSHPSYYKVWTYDGIYKMYETIMKSVA